MKIDLNESPGKWVSQFDEYCCNKDLILFFDNEDDAIWFVSNFSQKISVLGNSEVVTICGVITSNISEFSAQINVSLPCGYRISSNNPNALFDTLLNFETEPKKRTIIWSDTQHLLKVNPGDFELIFDLLVSSAYINRKGFGTVKENGLNYQVNQRNVFIFYGHDFDKKKLFSIINEKRSITPCEKPNEELKVQIPFEIMHIKNDISGYGGGPN